MLTVYQSALFRTGCRLALAAGLVVLWASSGAGQEWARKMFPVSSHDFGALARGAKAEYRFTFQNIYEEDVRIASVTSSCGCTNPQFSTAEVKTWGRGEVVAVIDTRSFTGPRQATLRVTLDKPFPAEVQLHVYCVIRSDVVVQPGVVQFGTVDQGSPAQQQLTISYAGRRDWRITNITSANEALGAQLGEPIISGDQVTYQLVLTLSEKAPPGDIQDHITIVTNDFDTRTASVPVPIEGAVVPSLTVRPSPLMLGVVAPGQSVTRYLTVKGKTPFLIQDIQSSEPSVSVTAPTEAKAVHMLPVKFTAGMTAGDVASQLRITTDVAGTAPLEVTVQARVVGSELPHPAQNPPPDEPPAAASPSAQGTLE